MLLKETVLSLPVCGRSEGLRCEFAARVVSFKEASTFVFIVGPEGHHAHGR